jgi:cytochrome oxidase Cu insertion factor (SCO1/SenC/PrrC family)
MTHGLGLTTRSRPITDCGFAERLSSCKGARGYDPDVIEQGDRAPDFELPDQDGRPVKLADFLGRPVVLYFYPKAET